ncbi:glycosyltransferase, partial [Bacteroidales bacterium OttesenSCG-928-K22]|nr:glycosyltransferase [Bacteroidales bacterium OttesenSCG-928-K22]
MSKILNNNVDVSVIMAAYNCEPYIRESIESILNQTFENFELIIVNDNSTDNTHEIIKSYNDSRIKILNNDNNYGAAYSRNVAIKHAQGKYLAIMDSDDVALQERLEKQVYFLENNIDIDIIGSFVFEIDKDGQKLSFVKTPINKNEVKSSILFRSPVIHSTTMIRHDFFISNDLFYNENYICAQDYEMFSRAIFLGNIYNIPQALVSYRWTDSNISTKKKDIQQQYSKEIISNLLSKFQIEPTKEDIEKHN